MIASLFYLEYICNNILIVHVVFLKLPHYCKPMKMTYSYEGKSFAMKMKFLKYWKDIPILYAFAFIHDLRGFLNVLPLLGTTKVDHTSYFSDVRTKLFEVFRKYMKINCEDSSMFCHPYGSKKKLGKRPL